MFTNVPVHWLIIDIAASEWVMRRKLTFKMASVRFEPTDVCLLGIPNKQQVSKSNLKIYQIKKLPVVEVGVMLTGGGGWFRPIIES